MQTNNNPVMEPKIPYDGSKYKKNLDSKLKIAYVCGDSAGPAWHEIYVPIKYMNEAGEVYAEKFEGMFEAKDLYNSDIIVLQRQNSDTANAVIHTAKKKGIKTVYHFTDNFWEIPPNNPAKPHYTPPILRRMEAMMSKCDMVTCTTPYLKERALEFNDNVKRPWELVEVEEFEKYLPPPRRDDDEQVRIGWVLTPHHEDDVYMVVNSLGQIARKYPETKFIFFGHYNQTIAQSIPFRQTEAYVGVPVWEYYEAAASLDLDIGIAPVIAHPFNRAKSRRKWFEYSAVSTATICTDYETYSIGVEHMVNAYKVKKNKAFKWTNGLEYLVENEKERKEIAKNAHDHVKNYHDPKKYIHKWIEMYKGLLDS